MKSFSILRTNTRLTTNVKVMVDSQYNLYLESIDSSPELSDNKFKKVQFNKNHYYDELVPFFFKGLPVDIAFNVKPTEGGESHMSTDFSQQFDDIYVAGARNIQDNKNYTEEYEYFAPLYIFKQNIPKYFIIFRIDGPGLVTLTKDNFRAQFLQNLKTVKLIDLTKTSVLGEWISNNFTNNVDFPVTGLNVDFRELHFTQWYGINYDSGGYSYNSLFFDEQLENENTLFDFEKMFLNGYCVNHIIFPHIINFSFLYDDVPATSTDLRTWSINRYAGFYLDCIEKIDAITPFVLPQLQPDVIIGSGNFIYSSAFGDPFLKGFQSSVAMWVEYQGNFYQVQIVSKTLDNLVVSPLNIGTIGSPVIVDTVTDQVVTYYKIISDLDLSGQQSQLNQRSCYINRQNQIVKVSDNSPYSINGFELADVNLIEINGIYHNVVLQGGYLTLVTDYGFTFSVNNAFTYYSGATTSTSLNLFITNLNSPTSFPIFRVNFTDIKDFDSCIIDTEFSKFEYEKRNDLCKTEETKMFLTDLRSSNYPQEFDDFTFKGKTEHVPVSSDYTGNLETFRIDTTQTPIKLSDLWRKNPIHCRWGYQNSLSAHDYPYLLNNSDIHEVYNRTVNTQNLLPSRSDRNLDYFYTINSGTTSYLHHSLHIEKNYGYIQDSSYHFELDKYLELGTYSSYGMTYSFPIDYFSLLFSPTQSFIDGEIVLNKDKFSYFEAGDNVVPNTTIFRGLKFKLFSVSSIVADTTSISALNLSASNIFQDYKFSIILSSNDYMVSDNSKIYTPYLWDYFYNTASASGSLNVISNDIVNDKVFIPGIVEIDTFYPNITSQYQATPSNVLSVGSHNFKVDKAYLGSTFGVTQSGIYRDKMEWQVIKMWETDSSYLVNDLVIWEDTVFKVISATSTSDPNVNPTNNAAFSLLPANGLPLGFPANFLSSNNPFWNYAHTYGTYSWVYRYDEYYQINNLSSTFSFWSPTQSYRMGDQVIYDNRYFTPSTSSIPIGTRPVSQNKKIQLSSGTLYWSEVRNVNTNSFLWSPVQLWNINSTYPPASYVVYNDTLYFGLTNSNLTSNDVPGISGSWRRTYSFVPDSSYYYSPSPRPNIPANTVIKITDHYYYCNYNPGVTAENPGRLTLDNGITIYINKRWKNVLVNIAINDNTIQSNNIVMDKTRNIERDGLYVETNSRLTAANFIRQINDLDTLYGFVDYVSYVVIEEDGTFKKYNFNNIKDLPYMLICEEADGFSLINGKLNYTSLTVDNSILKSSRSLVNGNIDNLQKIDFYNKNSLGVEISNVADVPLVSSNLNGQTNNINQTFYRHSGYYMPVFYTIDLFQKYEVTFPDFNTSGTSSLVGNYIFDDTLSLFGVMKQRLLSKVNPSQSVLKLKNNKSYHSIYPMLDEYGYMVADFFIFKSTWDFEYHLQTDAPNISSVPTLQSIYQTLYIQSIVQQYNNSL